MDIRKFFNKLNKDSTTRKSPNKSDSSDTENKDRDKSDKSELNKDQDNLTSDSEPGTSASNVSAGKNSVLTDERKRDIGPTDLGSVEYGPVQPFVETFPRSVFGKQSRSFTASYYKTYGWLEYSILSNRVFCFPCRQFGTDREDETFRREGCQNWKKLSEKLKKHNSSIHHITNNNKWNEYLKSKEKGNILTQVSNAHRDLTNKNRAYIKTLAEVCLLLARQGLAFRGHDESETSLNRGNFKEICKLLAKCNVDFAAYFNRQINHTSWQTQNDLIEILAKECQLSILSDIKKSKIFSIMVDEARAGRKEQMSLCIRYSSGLEVKERFLKFIDCSGKTTAAELYSLINQELVDLKLSELHLVGQSYDGAAVMSGQIGGLQAKIRETYPYAIYTHCMAHRVNLALLDTCKNVQSIANFFNTLQALYDHFSKPQHHVRYKNIMNELGIKITEISQLSDTRWVSRFSSCATVKRVYPTIIQLLEQEIDNRQDQQAVTAIGILSCMKQASFLVHLLVMEEILTILNILSQSLQSTTATLGGAVAVIKGVITTLEAMRSDDSYTHIHGKISDFAAQVDVSLDPPSSKRKKQLPVKLKDYVADSTVGATEGVDSPNVVEYWRVNVFYRIIDSVVGFLKSRFSEENLRIAAAIDRFFALDYERSTDFTNHYAECFNLEKMS